MKTLILGFVAALVMTVGGVAAYNTVKMSCCDNGCCATGCDNCPTCVDEGCVNCPGCKSTVKSAGCSKGCCSEGNDNCTACPGDDSAAVKPAKGGCCGDK